MEMETRSFKEIRKQYPAENDFLVLIDCETRELSSGELEVLGAKHVEPFKDFRQMYDAYKDYKKKGLDAWFVLPIYKDSFIMEQRFSLRRMGL
jgi:tRNA splicing endonuclease